MTRKDEIGCYAMDSYVMDIPECVTALEDKMLFARAINKAFCDGAVWADNNPKSPWINTHTKLPKPIDIEKVEDLANIQWCACHCAEGKGSYSYFIGYYAVSIVDGYKVWCDIQGQEVASPYDVDCYIPLPKIEQQ